MLRRVLSVLLALPAAALLPFVLGSWWLDAVVTDSDGYVAAVGPLADEPEVQSAVATRVTPAAVRAIDVPGRAEQLRRQVGRPALAPYVREVGDEGTAALQAYVEDAATRGVAAVVESPAFAELWRATNRSAHTALMDRLEEEPGTRATAIDIDLAPVLDATLTVLSSEGLRAQPTRGESTFAGFSVVGADDLDTARSIYQRIDGLGTVLALTSGALLALALVVSPLRRRTAILTAVLGGMGVGALALVLLGARSFLQTAVDPVETRVLVLDVWDALLGGLWTAVVVTAVCAVVLVLVMLLAPRVRRAGS